MPALDRIVRHRKRDTETHTDVWARLLQDGDGFSAEIGTDKQRNERTYLMRFDTSVRVGDFLCEGAFNGTLTAVREVGRLRQMEVVAVGES